MQVIFNYIDNFTNKQPVSGLDTDKGKGFGSQCNQNPFPLSVYKQPVSGLDTDKGKGF